MDIITEFVEDLLSILEKINLIEDGDTLELDKERAKEVLVEYFKPKKEAT